jgi:peroxiredoxin Q/BCP
VKSVEKGMLAPDFSLPSDEGENVSLIGLRGKRVVLYFYPRDDTPGCTIQACDFRNAMPRFEGVDAVVLGVSPDSEESHRRFREKFALTFPLLADEDHAVAEAYGAWGETPWGVGIQRSTFLIDADGVVSEVWRNVNPEGHMEMLAELLGA